MEALNDDCLLHICQYLNIVDFANLILGSDRVQQFAITSTPTRFTNLELIIFCPSARCLQNLCVMATIQELKTFLLKIGTLVEHLSLKQIDRDPDYMMYDELEFILQCFPNLQTLSIQDIYFDKNVLKKVSTHLKGLHLIRCSGIDNEWSNSLKRLTELTELTMMCNAERGGVSVALFDDCKKLTSLTVGGFVIRELFPTLTANRNSLRKLKFMRLGKMDIDISDFRAFYSVILRNITKNRNACAGAHNIFPTESSLLCIQTP